MYFFKPPGETTFLSTPSARRATLHGGHECHGHCDFYPRPPRGGRQVPSSSSKSASLFLSTPSARRATTTLRRKRNMPVFLSTPSARRATLRCRVIYRFCPISIHALREEGDRRDVRADLVQHNFYPRPPRGGRPFAAQNAPRCQAISIHALREEGDALALHGRGASKGDFYPRPPRGGRRSKRRGFHCPMVFLSTPSARRATGQLIRPDASMEISIHALREEGDSFVSIR